MSKSEPMEAVRRDPREVEAVTLLAGAVAHEINNPLTTVIGRLDLLARALPPEGREAVWVRQALVAAERIEQVVARLPRITRVVARPYPGLPAIMDLQQSSDSAWPRTS